MNAVGYIQVPGLGPGASWFDVARAGTPTRIWGEDPRLPYPLGVVAPPVEPADPTAGSLLLGASLVIGGFALTKAAIDHVMDTRRERGVDADSFETQHYRAAGFERGERTSVGKDLVSYAIGIAAMLYVLHETPKMLKELWP